MIRPITVAVNHFARFRYQVARVTYKKVASGSPSQFSRAMYPARRARETVIVRTPSASGHAIAKSYPRMLQDLSARPTPQTTSRPPTTWGKVRGERRWTPPIEIDIEATSTKMPSRATRHPIAISAARCVFTLTSDFPKCSGAHRHSGDRRPMSLRP